MKIRSNNLPAGRLTKAEGREGIRHTLIGADIVVWQELEELLPVLREFKNYSHCIGNSPAAQMRPVSFNHVLLKHIGSIHLPVGINYKWPKSIAEFRKFVVIEVFEHKFSKKKVAVFNIHMPHKATRWPRSKAYSILVKMILALAWVFEQIGYSVVLGGDWNAVPSSSLLEPVRKALHIVSPGGTHRSKSGKMNPIDFFAVKNCSVSSSKVLSKKVGDHHPIELTITL